MPRGWPFDTRPAPTHRRGAAQLFALVKKKATRVKTSTTKTEKIRPGNSPPNQPMVLKLKTKNKNLQKKKKTSRVLCQTPQSTQGTRLNTGSFCHTVIQTNPKVEYSIARVRTRSVRNYSLPQRNLKFTVPSRPGASRTHEFFAVRSNGNLRGAKKKR